ncbi:hypothetical protein F4779DRAFT_583317 [Xylariaceae sp. FL0662B]|nr:hypothetical protein F4779DRAFT_583317 [Xylariaceae sp. FL0662B]
MYVCMYVCMEWCLGLVSCGWRARSLGQHDGLDCFDYGKLGPIAGTAVKTLQNRTMLYSVRRRFLITYGTHSVCSIYVKTRLLAIAAEGKETYLLAVRSWPFLAPFSNEMSLLHLTTSSGPWDLCQYDMQCYAMHFSSVG